MNDKNIINLAGPINGTDATTKEYVDAIIPRTAIIQISGFNTVKGTLINISSANIQSTGSYIAFATLEYPNNVFTTANNILTITYSSGLFN